MEKIEEEVDQKKEEEKPEENGKFVDEERKAKDYKVE